ncbi:PAS domain-containing protein [Patescibacteria group bacterium]|nr:PAS domain-containing protein [Patescibacteria group bacterium]MBU1563529.1 PAS domain-containing protein [Patescibacteria group bacterium]MBU2068379.1 PAS domain-containing protein [Patescibacteria group bacterium]
MKREEDCFISQQAREDLENLERYIEELSGFLPLPVCTINPAGLIIDANQAFKDLTKHKESYIIGQGIESLFEDKKLVRDFLKRVFEEEKVEYQEMVLCFQDKCDITVNVSARARKDSQGNIIGCFWAIFDISELKKLQENLEKKVEDRTKALEEAKSSLLNILEDTEEARKNIEQERNKTRAILVNLPNGLIVFDKQGRIIQINSEAERVLNLKEADVLNKTISQVSKSPNLTKLYQTLGGKIEWTGQKYELVLDEPLQRFFQVSIAPVVIKKEVVGLMIVLHDVTRGKEIERLKTEFVSIAAHQLRTPLSAIKWSLKMLLDGDVGSLMPEQLDFLKKGYESNERMITLVNDLLNVARIEEGRFVYDLTSQSLEEIIKKEIDELSKVIAKKKIKLIFDKPKRTLPKVEVDKEKISIVIQNLLDNAIRFNNPGGKVTISMEYDKINLKVIVKDDGIGIPKDQQKRIFDKFFRTNNAIRLETEGTGLGLFICKNIIKAHGGRIWFESEKDKGSIFCFTLPIKS